MTRSEVKWLINQTAALAGQLEKIDAQLADLTTFRADLVTKRDACLRTLAVITSLQPAELALPHVRAHRSYGGRGQLRQFLLETIQSEPNVVLDANDLSFRAIERFGLKFGSPVELYDFKKNSVGRALRKMATEGLIEPAGRDYSGPYVSGKWRVKRQVPTAQELGCTVGGDEVK